jgi:glutaredoxin
MNRLGEKLLSAFDPGVPSSVSLWLDLSSLTAHARDIAKENEHVGAEIRHLVSQGFLREEAGKYARTEDGRLAVAGPNDLTLYTRKGCHLCEELKAQIAPLVSRFGSQVREVNIDADPVLRARYSEEVPVLFLGPRKVAKFKVDLAQLRRQLETVG